MAAPTKDITCATCGKVEVRTRNAKRCWNCARLTALSGAICQRKVRRAIVTGQLLPLKNQACVDCGKPAKVYDHRDYNKPLDVDPVCHSCNKLRGPGIPIHGLSLGGGSA